MSYGKPLPQPTPDTQPFWDGCREHRLRFQKCRQCGYIRWPPAIICPLCHSFEAEWIEASGRGKIYSFAVYHKAFHEAFEKDLPYVTAIVELEEGPHLLSSIVGCRPEELRCELPVEVVWDNVTQDFSLPRFKPLS